MHRNCWDLKNLNYLLILFNEALFNLGNRLMTTIARLNYYFDLSAPSIYHQLDSQYGGRQQPFHPFIP
jgi:hypothetical protein